jgi:hypothetical protein
MDIPSATRRRFKQRLRQEEAVCGYYQGFRLRRLHTLDTLVYEFLGLMNLQSSFQCVALNRADIAPHAAARGSVRLSKDE